MPRYAASAGAEPAAAPSGAAPAGQRLDGGDWPHTNRWLPWLLTAFLGMLYLIPFDNLDAPFTLPIDATIDRLLLGVILIAWIASLASKRSPGPRFYRNRLVLPVLLFVFVALTSIVIDLEGLARNDLLNLATKKLFLLLFLVLFFWVVATVVRPSEARSFGKLIVGLASLTALGTIWEYRTGFNAFWTWSDALMPGFSIGQHFISIDSSGRYNVVGPASHGLADVTLLSLAIPFAVSELIHSPERKQRLLYLGAVCLLVAGTFATSRKTSVFVPMAALVVFACYRFRQVLRFAPLLILLLPAVHTLAPGAMSGVRKQLFPDHGFFNQISVQGRTQDYDAVKPDIRTRMAIGKGYGTYDAEIFRLLDNQYLVLLIETGFLGLAAYLLMVLAVPWVCHRVIRGWDPARAPPALACAGAAVSFAVANFLFDALAFPQVPYAFLFVAGLAAVLSGEPSPAREPVAVPARAPGGPQLSGPRPAGALSRPQG